MFKHWFCKKPTSPHGQQGKNIYRFWLVAVLVCFFFSFTILGDETHANESEGLPPEVITQIESIVAEIDHLKQKITDIDANTSPASAAAEVSQQNISEALEQRQKSLEQIATGTVDLSLFSEQTSRDFNWQDELKDIFEPAILELKKITERPRKIERLRNERDAIKTRMNAATLAVREITELKNRIESKKVSKHLSGLQREWQDRQKSLKRQLAIVDFQLNETIDQGDSYKSGIAQAFQNFFTGRGLNLLIAIIVFAMVFLLLRLTSRQLEKLISRGQGRESRFLARLTHIIFQVATVLLAVIGAMIPLYIAGDWLVLTVLIIILVGFVFALRHSLPRYMDEVRLLLNIGPVREGERVVYRGVPWNVSRINIYSTIVNPALAGGRLRLPMTEMGNLVSRRYNKDEPWFPTKTDDVVILDDDTFGTVVLQTPEVINLRTLGGSVKTFQTADYLSMRPRNLSNGFGLFVTFGLDYRHQSEITSSVLTKLEKAITKGLEEAGYQQALDKLKVEFEQAAASSLDIKVLAFFSGEVASEYFSLSRLLQAIMVDTCNAENWVIPFNQITVHNADSN